MKPRRTLDVTFWHPLHIFKYLPLAARANHGAGIFDRLRQGQVSESSRINKDVTTLGHQIASLGVKTLR